MFIFHSFNSMIVWLFFFYSLITFFEVCLKKFLIKKKIGENEKIKKAVIYGKLIRFLSNSFFAFVVIIISVNALISGLDFVQFFSIIFTLLIKYILGFFVERKVISNKLEIKKSKLNKIILFTNLPELIITTSLLVLILTGK